MTWLTPLGFLGLIGLIVLIIIYIIKPNYQNKIISSTFIWKLSLKLRKKKIPISKLRNILLFICQVLAITAASLILAEPFIMAEREVKVTERVVIVDASASMMTKTDDMTRFEKAIEEVRLLAETTAEENGKISIIIAAESPYFAVREAGKDSLTAVEDTLKDLVDPSTGIKCSFGKGDVESAIKLAEEITSEYIDTEVLLYTDTTYVSTGKVVVKDMKDPSEWNAAILDVRAINDENYYRIEIDVACYGGIDRDIMVYCDVFNVNDSDTNLQLQAEARCTAENVTTLVFGNYDEEFNPDETIMEDVEIITYDYVTVYIEERDSFEHDNTFFLYGGKRTPLRIQYASANPNSYFASALMVMRDALSDRWDVEFVQVKRDQAPEMEGFDVYIFEHSIPKTLPSDGIVILSNPDYLPSSTGVRLGRQYYNPNSPVKLEKGDDHELLTGVTPENISVSYYTEITSYDGYVPLMLAGSAPVIMAKNEPNQKIVVMTFSLNYSDFSMLLDFPLFIKNIFDFYAPPTITEFVYDVNDSISLDSRSESLSVMGPSTETEFTEFPGSLTLTKPGVYTVSQTPISGEEVIENFYVQVPTSESNVAETDTVLLNPYFVEVEDNVDQDLLLYFALALVALLFVEWWLQSREHF